MTLKTATPSGLHGFVTENVLKKFAGPSVRAADLGAGPGAISARLLEFGCDVLAVDISASGYEAKARHVCADLNDADFADRLGPGSFDLVTAIEVIEHVESPIGFLRNIGRLLTASGVAVISTPNVDSLLARIRFLMSGKIRTMDEHSDPTHISPIYVDLLRRQFLPRAGLQLREHLVFPPKGHQLSRKSVVLAMKAASAFGGEKTAHGDHHVLVLGRA